MNAAMERIKKYKKPLVFLKQNNYNVIVRFKSYKKTGH
jgi:hypothetical protein